MVARRSNDALVFRAIADPSRRAILDQLLARGATPALALGDDFHASQPALSKHLRVLRDAGLVRVERRGRQQIYSLDHRPLQAVEAWLGFYRRFWETRLDALGRHLEKEK